MHEYEFRLVVEDSSSFLPFLQSLGRTLQTQTVYYAKPHFRYRNRTFETKCVESTRAVYHDRTWFRWVHSIETPFPRWSRSTYFTFLHVVGNYQNPFTVETRTFLALDSQAQLYTFRVTDRCYRLVFEWEYGTFPRPVQQWDPTALFASLSRYRDVYHRMAPFTVPRYRLDEQMTRRPVTCIEAIPEGDAYLYAHKLDGTFGLVYSYRDKIKEKWEGYDYVVRNNVSLGDGLVFAAERLEEGPVCLLDVYQVRGHETAPFCRRQLLTQFLPELNVSEGYCVQTYVSDPNALPPQPLKTDGVIVHDVMQDVIFKLKTSHSVDLVYYQQYFYLPTGRIKCSERGLEDGSVYELSTMDGRVLRKRTDRFKGNTADQLKNILKKGWHGPPIEPLPKVKTGKKWKHA